MEGWTRASTFGRREAPVFRPGGAREMEGAIHVWVCLGIPRANMSRVLSNIILHWVSMTLARLRFREYPRVRSRRGRRIFVSRSIFILRTMRMLVGWRSEVAVGGWIISRD